MTELSLRRGIAVKSACEMPPLERLEHYPNCAQDADRLGGPARTSYLIIAEQWERLATEAAKEANVRTKRSA